MDAAGVEPGGAMVELLTRNSVGNHERTRNRPAELPKHHETPEIRKTPGKACVMPASSPSPSHSYQLTRRRLLTTGAGAATAFGLLRFAPAASADASTQSYTTTDAASDAAVASVDLSGSWSFTPAGQGTTSITVPGGGWYKQGFTNVAEAVYSRTITVPDSGQPQSVWIEFGAVNHQATLSVDGRVVATQTTAFTPSNFDITAYVTPGSTHTISVDVKGRNALKTSSTATIWCLSPPTGAKRSPRASSAPRS